MQLDGKTPDYNMLGERVDLDYFKEKLQKHVNNGVPLDHPSLEKLHKQIELLEDAIVVYKCVRDPQRRIL